MADNLSVKDGAGSTKSLASRELSTDVHLMKHLRVSSSGSSPGVNPQASFSRPANTTTYAARDLVANNETANSVTPFSATFAPITGGGWRLKRVRVEKTATTVANALFRLHLFSAAVAVVNGDNGAFVPTLGSSNYFGSLTIDSFQAFSDCAIGFGVPDFGGEIVGIAESGTAVYGLLEALQPYAPASGETFTFTFEIEQQ